MGIALNSSFTVNAALPLDDRTEFADLAARDALLAGRRWEGMECYVKSEEKYYSLVGGIANGNWVERTGGGGAGGGLMIWQAPQVVADTDQLTLGLDARQALKLSSASDVTVDADVFSSAPQDGTEIFILNTGGFTIKIPYSDTVGGFKGVGDLYIGPYQTATMIYNETDQRYYDLARRA